MMNIAEDLDTISLSEDDIETLKTIYYTRRKFLFSAISSIGLFIAFLYRYIIIHSFTASKLTVDIVFVICLLLFFLIVGSILFLQTVYPFKRDLNFGKKVIYVYTITNKIYIPTTDEYFFSINDLKILNYEVDQRHYNAKQIGDEVKVLEVIIQNTFLKIIGPSNCYKFPTILSYFKSLLFTSY